MANIKTKFAVVILNETNHWQDSALKSAAGEIWTAYLVDLNRAVNLAELRTSYEMLPLYYLTKERLSDELDEDLRSEFGAQQDPIYQYTYGIDLMLSGNHAIEVGEETHEYDDSIDADSAYMKIEQDRIESEVANQRCWNLTSTPISATIRP